MAKRYNQAIDLAKDEKTFLKHYNNPEMTNGQLKAELNVENTTPINVLLRSEARRAKLTVTRNFRDGDDALPTPIGGEAAVSASPKSGKPGGKSKTVGGEEAGTATAQGPFSFRAKIFEQIYEFAGETRRAAFAAFIQKLAEANFNKMEFKRDGTVVGLNEISNGDLIEVRKQMSAADIG